MTCGFLASDIMEQKLWELRKVMKSSTLFSSDKSFKGTVVNRTCGLKKGGSL